MRRYTLPLIFAALMTIGSAPAAHAQQSVNFWLGGFAPQAIDSRSNSDVLVNDQGFLATFNRNSSIDVGKFGGVTVGGEWLFGLGPFFDGGLGLGFYQKTVPTYDINFVDQQSGGDILADLKLRIVPFSATVRFLPLGRRGFEPYIGTGVNMYYWRYAETGEFVDYSSCTSTGCNTFSGNFVGSGGAVGPVVLGGARVPIGSAAIGGEIRWQGGSGKLPASQDFAGSKINLGGINYLATLTFRF